MDAQVSAALVGAVVGAGAVGAVTYFLKIYEDRRKATRAFELFSYFHDQWKKIAGGEQRAQQRDYPLILQSLPEIMPLMMNEGHGSTRKIFLEYVLVLRELARYVEDGKWGLTGYSEAEMRKLIAQAKSDLQASGILGSLE